VQQEAGASPVRQIERAYLIALSRPPTREEQQLGLAALRQLTEHWAQHLVAAGQPDEAAAGRRALATYCHALVNSAGFLYVD
jgi:hypothetical protein